MRFASIYVSIVALLTISDGILTPAAWTQEPPQLPLPKDTLPAKLEPDGVPLGLTSLPGQPETNPASDAKIELGRRLFFDPILSTDNTVSCATCHQPDHGFASPDAVAVGIQGRRGTRNAPTVLNVGYAKTLSWDGRDESLEAQVLGPLTNENELGGDLDAVLAKLRKNERYVREFSQAFGQDNDNDVQLVTIDHVAKAIASFERTLITGNNGADRFRNQEYGSLSKAARSGMWIFESRGNCWKCHSGPNLTDEQFHNTGVSFGTADRDTGRMQATDDPAHKFQFKTPSLRNIELTAPYMHDGSIKTLREVVEFYNRGGSPKDELLDDKLEPLNLTEEEVGFLVEFLKAMTEHQPKLFQLPNN